MSSVTMSNSAVRRYDSGCLHEAAERGRIDDSVEEFDKYLTAVAEGFENPELRRLYAEKSGETIDWLAEQVRPFPPIACRPREPWWTTTPM